MSSSLVKRSALEMSGFKMEKNGVSERVKNITVSAIKEMALLAEEYEDVVYLAQGTPDFLTPKHIRDRVKKELDSNPAIGKYAHPFNGITELKNSIADTLNKKRGIDADPKREIYVTVGAMEAIATAVLTVVNPQDEVILLSPCFPSHIIQISLAQGIPVFVNLDEDKNWALDIDEFRSKITKKTKAVIICNPANPTGTVFGKDDILKIAELARKHDFWIITDEPYDFLVYDNNEFFSAVQIKDIKDRVIGCFSFSKEYAMTGFRIGYVYAGEGIINQMLKIHDAFVVTAPTVSQYAALEALQGDGSDIEYFKSRFEQRRELVCERMSELGDLFEFKKPQGAYYIFPRVNVNINDYEFAIKLLKEAKVAVVPGSSFGPNGEGHIRVCYAGSEDDINKAFDRIQEWWENNKSELIKR